MILRFLLFIFGDGIQMFFDSFGRIFLMIFAGIFPQFISDKGKGGYRKK